MSFLPNFRIGEAISTVIVEVEIERFFGLIDCFFGLITYSPQ
jgi:hypothetical protein